MATRGDIKDVVHNSLETILTPHVTDVSERVMIAESDIPHRLPSMAFEEWVRPVETGGTDIHVDHFEKIDGMADRVVYRRDNLIHFDITVYDETDENKEPVYQDVVDYFGDFNSMGRPKYPTDLHSDIQEVTVDRTRDADREHGDVRGDRVQVEIEYGRYTEFSDFAPIRKVRQWFERDPADVLVTDESDLQ